MARWTFENKFTTGNVVQIVVIIGGFIYGYATLSGTVSQSAEAVKGIPSLETRLTKVENVFPVLADVKEALKDSQSSTNRRLDKMDDTLLSLSKAVAGLDATLRALDK